MKKKVLTLTAMLVLVCSTAFAYVGNTRTGKFYRDGCRYVQRMSESNKEYIETREEAIDEGYVPCKVCRP